MADAGTKMVVAPKPVTVPTASAKKASVRNAKNASTTKIVALAEREFLPQSSVRILTSPVKKLLIGPFSSFTIMR